MSVPPLHLSNNFDSYTSGEVTIHPSAVLAPGVILQAAVNSKMIIGPGVCIGMGSILQVSEGTLEVEAGANLGAGFLMVGKGKIGANACVGSATTVFNCSIEPGKVIPPGSILGDTSRQIEQTQQLESSTNNGSETSHEEQPEAENSLDADEETVMSSTTISATTYWKFKHQSTSSSESSPTSSSQPPPVEEKTKATNSIPQKPKSSQPPTESPNSFGNQIYGQLSINRLLVTLFPHRQSLNDSISDDHSE
ncbi:MULTISPECIES: transferase [unclassified Nodularia (in: cyanobacteria)]|uniref:transferase n=1 Tax=unclassified Nodularia (in: cyanobacteria) TaxID=2656917 RepID=UPI0018819E4B|nr:MULTISPECIES: transferase [unclassified Nodularia (in: cyanobacteria)]MBE9198382.1 transferase [Nodularia sp. LEGE 06071]MCC2691153.1 transferase [Nodularia sp. LEGE 04288]